MALRCIYCSRSERQTELSKAFACIDREECDRIAAYRAGLPTTVCIYFDGACLGTNKIGGQPLGVGVYTTIAGVHAPEWSGIKAIEWGSNNDAEWKGFLYALSVAVLMRKANEKFIFKIFGDSEIVIRSFNDVYKVNAKFKPYKEKAEMLRKKLGTTLVAVTHIAREYNIEADKLSKEALLLHKQ